MDFNNFIFPSDSCLMSKLNRHLIFSGLGDNLIVVFIAIIDVFLTFGT